MKSLLFWGHEILLQKCQIFIVVLKLLFHLKTRFNPLESNGLRLWRLYVPVTLCSCFTALHGPTVQQVRGHFSKQCSLCSAEEKMLNTENGMYDGHVFTMHHLSCENLTYHGNIDVFWIWSDWLSVHVNNRQRTVCDLDYKTQTKLD